MTLASSGEISIGGTVANRSINVELNLSPTANSNLDQANFRSLAGAGGSGTQINMSDFWGKSAITISLASLSDIYGDINPGGTAYAEYVFNSNGATSYFSSSGNGTLSNWASPTTAGIGSNYWIRFTQTASFGPSTETGNARNTWIQLSSVPTFGLSKTANGGSSRTYTAQIATDSGGANIVATKSVVISVEVIF
jgi:hypothetical protein